MGLVTPFYVDPDTACRPAGSTALRYAQDDTNIKMPLRSMCRTSPPLLGFDGIFHPPPLRIFATISIFLLTPLTNGE